MSGAGQKPPSAVLFACGMNTVRSPMAAGILSHLFPHTVYVASAGVHEGEPDSFAAAVMEEIGIDVSRHRPSTFEGLGDTSFDLVITLAPEAHHHAVELTRTMALDVEYWPAEDPTVETGSREQRLSAYRRLRDALLARIKTRFDWQPPPSG